MRCYSDYPIAELLTEYRYFGFSLMCHSRGMRRLATVNAIAYRQLISNEITRRVNNQEAPRALMRIVRAP